MTSSDDETMPPVAEVIHRPTTQAIKQQFQSLSVRQVNLKDIGQKPLEPRGKAGRPKMLKHDTTTVDTRQDAEERGEDPDDERPRKRTNKTKKSGD